MEPIQTLFEEANEQCRTDGHLTPTIYYYEMSDHTLNKLIEKGEVSWTTKLPSGETDITGQAMLQTLEFPPTRYLVIGKPVIGTLQFISALYPKPTYVPIVWNNILPLGKTILRKAQIKSP